MWQKIDILHIYLYNFYCYNIVTTNCKGECSL